LIERDRELGADMLSVTREAYGADEGMDEAEEDPDTGIAIPATIAVLGVAFLGCALLIAGMPPLSGFIAKLAMLQAALGQTQEGGVAVSSWAFLVMLLISGLAAIVAMSRAGIRAFWEESDRTPPRIRLVEFGPIAALLLICVAQTVAAGPVMNFMNATARSARHPEHYVRVVLEQAPSRPHGGGGT
jgi:multicomponent K+:H+ antiporter subunit D